MVVETRAAARKRKVAEEASSTSKSQHESVSKGGMLEGGNQDQRPAKRARSKAKPERPVKRSTAQARRRVRPRLSSASKLKCYLCMEPRSEDRMARCVTCKTPYNCLDCLRQVFARAFERVGPSGIIECWRCRTAIPVSILSPESKNKLSPEKVFQYHQRVEEWAAQPPLYCPRPQCSAFIHPRLYANKREPIVESHSRVFDLHGRTGGRDYFKHFAASREATACCPKCFTIVCTSCRNEFHGEGGKCDPDAIKNEAGLAEIQQCPACSTAVEHAGGCSIVSCNCGKWFCVDCGQWPCECGPSYRQDRGDEED